MKLSSGKLKIVFVGIPDMAIVCLSNLLIKKFNIVGVIPPRRTNPSYYHFKNFVNSKRLNFIDFKHNPNETECIEQIKKLNADIGVVCSYNDKLSKEFLETTKMGYINSHPSLLPQYRGGMPYFHIINNGEKESGITLHFMNEQFDCGDIIYQEKLELTPIDTMGTLFNKTTYMISDALIEVLLDIEEGKKINRVPQLKEGNFKKASSVTGNFRIDFNHETVEEIERLVRAANPFYQVYCMFRGVNLQIIKSHIEYCEHKYNFGKIVSVNKNELKIAGIGGYLYIDIFQVGTWGIFNNQEFFEIFSPTDEECLV